jgi:hypothetical protein
MSKHNAQNKSHHLPKAILTTTKIHICRFATSLQHVIAAASDKVYQLLAYGRWFSPGTPASSTTKTGRHDIAEILLKVALNTKKSIKSNRSS